MEKLEKVLLDNNEWRIEYRRETPQLWYARKEYWGADTQHKALYIYNTEDPKYVNEFVECFKQQYRHMW